MQPMAVPRNLPMVLYRVRSLGKRLTLIAAYLSSVSHIFAYNGCYGELFLLAGMEDSFVPFYSTSNCVCVSVLQHDAAGFTSFQLHRCCRNSVCTASKPIYIVVILYCYPNDLYCDLHR